MPVNVLDPNPTIKVIFRGFIVTHIKDGEPAAQIGAFADDPCHAPKISVIKINADGQRAGIPSTFNLSQDIFLDVVNTSRPDIQTFQKDNFNRNKRKSPDQSDEEEDFRYFIDLKKDVLKQTPFVIDDTKLKPIFHIQQAVFYTRLCTGTRLVIKRPTGDEDLGFAAEQIAARITLDQPNSKAVLRNGGQDILVTDATEAAQGISYLIDFNCDCNVARTEPKLNSDFILVYQTMVNPPPANQQVDIHGVKVPGARGTNPQVLCTGGNR
jgi:hypothetical protein